MIQPRRTWFVLSSACGGIVAPFSPLSVPGIRLWLKAADIVGLNDGDPVASWVDSSLVSGDAVQAVAGLQPVYKINVINGLPVVRFTNDYAVSPSVSLTDFAVYSVFQAPAGGIVYEHGPNATASPGCYLWNANGGSINASRGALVQTRKDAGVWGVGAVPLLSEHYYGGTHATHLLYKNASLLSTSDITVGDPGNSEVTDTFTVGGGGGGRFSFADVDIAELIAYSAVPSGSDVAALRAYFTGLYGPF